MSDTPQVLLAHHLEALRLPTFLREYDKLARKCAAEGVWSYPAIALIISLGSHPASHISGISHSPAEVTRWWRFDHAAGKSASFLFVDHPSLDRFAVETPVGAYPECGQLVLP